MTLTREQIEFIKSQAEVNRDCNAQLALDLCDMALSSLEKGWQPIETAPRDGTKIILAWGTETIVGWYLDNSKTVISWEGFRPHSNVAWPQGNPTHWMPLPEKP